MRLSTFIILLLALFGCVPNASCTSQYYKNSEIMYTEDLAGEGPSSSHPETQAYNIMPNENPKNLSSFNLSASDATEQPQNTQKCSCCTFKLCFFLCCFCLVFVAGAMYLVCYKYFS
ncbi:uncharacterized protein NEMAJ01_0886 [Nematocida major]|uniref:uncharacterized protein n=1 Tax=Nematocida major TaxID=1912982 RepID=UPI002008C4B7|nr:uncharacterized protein NEMAJ01_0886 [Nematocida major]KAH9385990.1 hypothetical protein NEMAJ01_0886 [Nematocida major]